MNIKKQIFIIEDKDVLRNSLSELLQETYIVKSAANGSEFVDSLRIFLPDLILLDLMLPYPLDGFSILRIIKSNTKTQKIPIIIISGLSDEDKIIQALELGANDFLIKPIKAKELLLKVKNLANIVQVNEEFAMNKRLVSSQINPELFEKDSFDTSFESIVEQLTDENVNTIPAIAQRMSISVSSLERKIKAKYNLTPIQYLIEIKLMKAEMLLRTGNLSVKEIAVITGFNSPAYFCHCFKKKYGKPPKVYASSFVIL